VQRRQVAAPSGWTKAFSGQLNGTVNQTSEPGGAIVDLSARVTGGIRGRLRLRLGGTPLPNGGLSMTGSQVDLLAAGHSTVLEGRITALQGTQFVASTSDSSGSKMELRGSLNIDSSNDTVTGSLSGSPGGSQ
jgi:hypothetical protein